MAMKTLFAVVYIVTTEMQDRVNKENLSSNRTSIIYGIYNSPQEAEDDIQHHIKYMKRGKLPYSWMTAMSINEIDTSFIIMQYEREEYHLNILPDLMELEKVILKDNETYDSRNGVTLINS